MADNSNLAGIVIPVTLDTMDFRDVTSDLRKQEKKLSRIFKRKKTSLGVSSGVNSRRDNSSTSRQTSSWNSSVLASRMKKRRTNVAVSRLNRQHQSKMNTGFGAIASRAKKPATDYKSSLQRVKYDRWLESLKKQEHTRVVKRNRAHLLAIAEDTKRNKAQEQARQDATKATDKENKAKVAHANWIQRLKKQQQAKDKALLKTRLKALKQGRDLLAKQRKLQDREEALARKKSDKASSIVGKGVAGAVIGAGVGLGAVIQSTFAPAQDYLLYENMMLSVSDGQEQFNARMQMTAELAEETGQNMVMLGKEYAKFSASNPTVGGMSEAEMSDGFSDVARLTTIRGGKQEDISLAMKALTQMLSKGKISAEELRGQLGERMAGSFKLFAEGMGMTVGELDKAMKEGQVFSAEALPKFFDRLEEEIKNSSKYFNTATHAIGRFQNAVAKSSGESHRAGWDNGLAEAIDGVAMLTEGVGAIFTSFAPSAQSAGRIIKATFLDVSNALIDLSFWFDHFSAHLFNEDKYANVKKVGKELTGMEMTMKLILQATLATGVAFGALKLGKMALGLKKGKLTPNISDVLIALRTGGIKGLAVFAVALAAVGSYQLFKDGGTLDKLDAEKPKGLTEANNSITNRLAKDGVIKVQIEGSEQYEVTKTQENGTSIIE